MGRKKIVKIARVPNNCPHNAGFDFYKVKDGVKRVCRLGCGHSVTEISNQVTGPKPEKKKKTKGRARQIREFNL
jgi:hypothetical protein